MKQVANCLAGLVAALHFGFLTLEMFLWTTPVTARTFGKSPEFLESTAVLAANQGLYNGFLAAGLIWGIAIDSGRVLVFFCACVIVAGVFGAVTVKPSILFIEALPAAIARDDGRGRSRFNRIEAYPTRAGRHRPG